MKRLSAWALALLLAMGTISAYAETYFSGYAETPLYDSSANKVYNIDLAIGTLNGWMVFTGDTFSFNDVIGPRTKEAGYRNAENGRGVKVRGGGVAQVATTVYLALKDWEGVTIDEMRSYGSKFCDGYVWDSADAVLVDYAAGTDFSFTNWGDPFAISVWEDGEYVYCSLEGTEWNEDDSYIIGYAETVADGSSTRVSNIALAASAMTGVTLYSGDEFSFNDIIGPRTSEYGYGNAVNGRGVRVCGGGVAQLASTVYLAVKDLDDVIVTEKRTYGDSYNQSYVQSKDDAIVTDYVAGTDFRFDYFGDGSITLYTYINEDDMLCCEVWQSEGDAWVWLE